MKLLFLIFHGFDEANGISKKIRYQTKALRECGADVRMCYYQITDDGNRRWMVNDEVIADLGSGKMAKAKKGFSFVPSASMRNAKASSWYTSGLFTTPILSQST